jgi:hypothetical protein
LPTAQNKKLEKRTKPCYQIFTWNYWYFAKKHNSKISSEMKTQLIAHLIYKEHNTFKQCTDSNCQWSTALPETKHCLIWICAKSSLAHPTIGRIKTLLADDTHFRMSFKENPKHSHKQEQKTFLTIKEAQTRKKAHKITTKNSTLLSDAQTKSSQDRIHEILEHVEMNSLEQKFKRHNTAWTDGSLLKTNSNN